MNQAFIKNKQNNRKWRHVPNRIARRTLRGSSIKVALGGRGVTIRPDFRSLTPDNTKNITIIMSMVSKVALLESLNKELGAETESTTHDTRRSLFI